MRDQQGNPITSTELYMMLAESILANLIAFDEAGVPRKEVNQIVGPDGGTLVGRGVMLQTPVTKKLSTEGGKQLFDTYRSLLFEYDEGKIPAERLRMIREKHRVAHKVEALRKAL